MKLSVLANLYRNRPLDEVLTQLEDMGVEAVEIGTGGYSGKDHADPAKLLAKEDDLREFCAMLKRHPSIEIAALATHGNPVHPVKEIAKGFDADFRNTVLLAEKLGIDTVITFSGCPGDCPESKHPNFVTCPWPEEFLEVLDYQWNEVLIPYWKEAVAFANAHGVTKIALEMRPGFCVYNPETLLKLRRAVGDTIGANFDPSHLIWQGMDPVAAIRQLEGAIYHVHAKDTKIDPYNKAANGVLDTKHYGDELHRAWVFRTVGYGNGAHYWKDLVSNLRLCGYDKVLSIAQEDSLLSIDEGLTKAVAFLKEVLIHSPKPTAMA